MLRRLPAVLTLMVCMALAAPAVAAAAPPPGSNGQDDKVGGDYVVQPGDTLSQIAVDHGVEGGHQALLDKNDDVLTDADHIYAGQVISVDGSAPRRSDGTSFSPLVTPGTPDLTAEQLAPQPLPTSFAGTSAGAPWVVSLGDSFISGEAGRWAGNIDGDSTLSDALGPNAYNDNPAGNGELIPLCHRSKSAMIHIADDGSPTDPGSAVNSLNLACSGAQTGTITEDGAFKPGLDFYSQGGAQGQALMLQQFAQNNDVRMVVVSIGGNDFGFGPVIQTCVEDYLVYFSYCSKDSTVTDKINATNIQTVTTNITTALQHVQQAMRNAGKADNSWTLVFNLNPDPLVLGDGFRYGETYGRQDTGGCGVYDVDATWAGTDFIGAVGQAQQAAVKNSGITGAVLLDLGGWLDDRKLCSTTTNLVGGSGGAANWQAAGAVDVSEWANQIHTDTVDGPYFQQESLHPNYWAQLAARSCVRQVYHGGAPVGGSCVRSGTGLTSRGEPVMTLQGS
jgi:LysM repeat protein